MIDSGIILIKYWLEVSQEEQTRRFEESHPRRTQDLEAEPDGPGSAQPLVRLLASPRRHVGGHRHAGVPWYVVDSNEKRRARLNCIAHFLSLIPYEEVPRPKIVLPERKAPGGYVEPDYPYRYVPDRY